MNAALRSRVRE